MANRNPYPEKSGEERGGKLIPTLLRIFGTLILISAIALLIPVSMPHFLGYEVYEVVSASMAPEIPVGSMLFVKPVSPEEVQEGDVIAFESMDSVVTHRVVENRTVEGEFITRGDANAQEDVQPVPYASLIGRVKLHIPAVGTIMSLLSGNVGKLYMAVYVLCGLLFHVLAGALRRRGRP